MALALNVMALQALIVVLNRRFCICMLWLVDWVGSGQAGGTGRQGRAGSYGATVHSTSATGRKAYQALLSVRPHRQLSVGLTRFSALLAFHITSAVNSNSNSRYTVYCVLVDGEVVRWRRIAGTTKVALTATVP